MKKRHIQPVIFALLVVVLTAGFGWTFNGELFAHELDHKHHVLSVDPMAHLEAHQHDLSSGDRELDAATHLSLHAFGQYSPFFFNAPLLVPASIGMETLTLFVFVPVPESIPDSPLHPPRNTFAS
jgi:hypothetical protein